MSEPLALFVDAAGLKTHVYVAGDGGRYPVVFVHGGGLGSDSRSWTGTMSRLSRRSYAFDMAGFGRSAAPAIRYDNALMLKHLRDVLDVLALDRVILVGHSLGGHIALAAQGATPVGNAPAMFAVTSVPCSQVVAVS